MHRPAAAAVVVAFAAAAADYYCYYLMFECITYQWLAAVRELIAFCVYMKNVLRKMYHDPLNTQIMIAIERFHLFSRANARARTHRTQKVKHQQLQQQHRQQQQQQQQ